MARISRENDPEHLAALKMLKSKSEKKPSSFKDLFKGSRSRTSLPTNTTGGSPEASPSALTRHGGVEDMAPGFEQVGMLPVQRSRTLDLDEWEKVKEENRDLSHAAKIQVYKEREELKRRRADEGEGVVRKLFNVEAQDNRKDQKSLEVGGVMAEHGNNNAKHGGTVDDGHKEASSECEQNPIHEDAGRPEADQSYHACVPPTSNTTTDNPVLLHMPFSASKDEVSNSFSGDTSALPEAHVTTDRCSSWTTLDNKQQEQSQPVVWLSETTDLPEDDAIETHSAWSSAQPITGATSLSKVRFSRGNFKQEQKVDNESFISTTGLVRAGWSFSRDTQTFKLGPFKLDPSIATVLISIPAMFYTAILFVVAMQGPVHFMVMVWKLGVLSFAYKCVGDFLGWRKDGSRDILLVPAEEVCAMVEGYCMIAMTALFESLAEAIAAALRVMDSDNEM